MKVLLIEDDARLVLELGSVLKRAGFEIETCGTLKAAYAFINLVSFDAVIADRNLPDGDAVSLLQKLRREGHDTPILMLTARGSIDDKISGLEAGSDDYLVKPFLMPELIARVRALLRRPGSVSRRAGQVGNLSYEPTERTFLVDEAPMVLSRHELLVLEKLFLSAGAVVPMEPLLDYVYGAKAPASNTLSVHVHNIRRHLSSAGATVQISTVRGLGYLLMDQTESN